MQTFVIQLWFQGIKLCRDYSLFQEKILVGKHVPFICGQELFVFIRLIKTQRSGSMGRHLIPAANGLLILAGTFQNSLALEGEGLGGEDLINSKITTVDSIFF